MAAMRELAAMRVNPVKGMRQRRFGGPTAPISEQGDCWATAVACYAGLTSKDRNELHRRISISRTSRGSNGSKWWDVTERFLSAHDRLGFTTVDTPDPDLLYLATGYSVRGVLHTVLAYGDGTLWFDPHPNGNGLIKIDEWVCWFIEVSDE